MSKQWTFCIDRGGTFTDIIGVDPNGQLHLHKLLSENPNHYENSSIQGIRKILKLDKNQPIPINSICGVCMGTTIATNALLEHKGEDTALIITKGFADTLEIAYQQRPNIFALNIQKPSPLYKTVIEIDERLNANGEVLIALNEQKVEKALNTLYQNGLNSLAITLMHAYQFPKHEQRIEKIAKNLGFKNIISSHRVNAVIKLISRGHTTVIDAYLTPVFNQYVKSLKKSLGKTRLQFMQSNGGLCESTQIRAKNAIFSGPAGGIVGAVETARLEGYKEIITFDMGGTSTDVSHYNGEYKRIHEKMINGLMLRTPMLDIHSVAAGGGSICQFDEMRLSVGPESAGANPGPACYGNGGPLTITDCNVMLGKIDPNCFPKLFGDNQNEELDKQIVENKLTQQCQEIFTNSGIHYSPKSLANAYLRVAVENMANAIKKISTQRGYDIQNYLLNCFGGAGPQHACLVADALNMKKILYHPLAGVLSAYGIGLSDIRDVQMQTLNIDCTENSLPQIESTYTSLKKHIISEIHKQGIDSSDIKINAQCHIRYKGSDSTLEIELQPISKMIKEFEISHLNYFGFKLSNKQIIVDSISVEGIGKTDKILNIHNETLHALNAFKTEKIEFECGTLNTPFYQHEHLPKQQIIQGPAIIINQTSTLVIEPNWNAKKLASGTILITKSNANTKNILPSTQLDPSFLEIFNNLFMTIADEMGITLANTAHSVNIKERFDFSCAIFDAEGNLIANAPHIPVHLGSMSASVKSILNLFQQKIQIGDVFLSNSPYAGGTHLPDLTVITPVFNNENQISFLLASRAHHADIGGITPGSIPAFSHNIHEEGILIEGIKIIENNRFLQKSIEKLFSENEFPARNITQNIADLQAQIAANNKGVQGLMHMIHQYSLPVVNAYMQFIQDAAEESIRKAIAFIKPGDFKYLLDNGTQICVAVRIDYKHRQATIDFTGTSAQQNNNFNAPLAVCKAAVLYVFRTLIEKNIPLNEGCMKPINIIVPENCMLNPKYPAAVVAGNVETSQAIVDTLYAALGIVAASQGTMNNLIFGNKQFQYYETIGGGAGAGENFNGADAIHTHMTNSRATDPEILETRFPVLLEEFSIRKNSGGSGKFTGGNGIIRKLKFLQNMQVNILSNHRKIPPFGLNGGIHGHTGKNTLHQSTHFEILPACATIDVNSGDTLTIETPGGGGFGKPEP